MLRLPVLVVVFKMPINGYFIALSYLKCLMICSSLRQRVSLVGHNKLNVMRLR